MTPTETCVEQFYYSTDLNGLSIIVRTVNSIEDTIDLMTMNVGFCSGIRDRASMSDTPKTHQPREDRIQ
ncbi:hypothetical protein V1477_019450 [Vespula maculifrons]|uniref:Uncharacterized protein n=1 Tax=Vespula maculifrons TaxID=7453 RepID=A0ABD2ASK4_VESMC